MTPRLTPLERLDEETDEQIRLQVPQLARVDDVSRMTTGRSDAFTGR
jgi:hypothetical protein